MRLYLWTLLILALVACNGNNGTADGDDSEEHDTLKMDSSLLDTRVPDNTQAEPDTTGLTPDIPVSGPDQKEQNSDGSNGNESRDNGKDATVTNDDPTSVYHALTGRWKWVKTVCCGRNPRTYRDTLDYDIIREFTTEGTLKIWHDNELVETMSYEFVKTPVFPNRPGLKLSGFDPGPAVIQINEDDLVLNYGYMDLQTEYYKRVR